MLEKHKNAMMLHDDCRQRRPSFFTTRDQEEDNFHQKPDLVLQLASTSKHERRSLVVDPFVVMMQVPLAKKEEESLTRSARMRILRSSSSSLQT